MEEKRVRHRTALSCSECRRLKLKCTRIFPCTNCIRRNCGGICPTGTLAPSNRVNKTNVHLALLTQRVADLEILLTNNGLVDLIPEPLELPVKGSRSSSIASGSGIKREDLNKLSMNGIEEESEGGGEEEGRNNNIRDFERDLVEGVGSLTIREEDGSTRYLGLSSGSAYFDNTDSSYSSDEETSFKSHSPTSPPAVATIVTTYPFTKSGSAYPVSLGESKVKEIEHIRSYLPPQVEGRRLASNYWNYVSFMFEPLQEEVFWEDYFVSAYTVGEDHGTKLACVYIILALGSLFDRDAPATFNASANQYFLLSQTALSAARFLSINTSAAAETLHLTGNFLFNTHKLQDGGETFFCLFSLALRMSSTMGLHHDGSKFNIEEPELERRRLLFYELMVLDRLQAFLSGRPYVIQDKSFDTKMPLEVDDYQIIKFKVGKFLGKVIDDAFSIKVPTYTTIEALDQELRDLYETAPLSVRSGVLPVDAFLVRPIGPSHLPIPPPNSGTLKDQMRKHTSDMYFAQIALYLHKPPFTQALIHYPDEPLKAPWAASVAVVILEAGSYILALAKNWIKLDPILCPRWWHIFFHAYAAATSQASLIIKSPKSILTQFAWTQLNEALGVFELASKDGAPVIMLLPKIKALRNSAFNTLQGITSIPQTLPDVLNGSPTSESPGSVNDISALGATLVRKPRKGSKVGELVGAAGIGSNNQFTPSPPISNDLAASNPNHYTPYDLSSYPTSSNSFERDFLSYHYDAAEDRNHSNLGGEGEDSNNNNNNNHEARIFHSQELINRGLAAQALLQQHQQRIPLSPLNTINNNNILPPQNSFQLPPFSSFAQSSSHIQQHHQQQHQQHLQDQQQHLHQEQRHQQQHQHQHQVRQLQPQQSQQASFQTWDTGFPTYPVQLQQPVGTVGGLVPNVQSTVGLGDEDWRLWSEVMQNAGLDTSPPSFP